VRLTPRHWHNETWICSIRGHVVPAAAVTTLRPEDHRLGIDVADGLRLCRCLRCDCWIECEAPSPGAAATEVLAPLGELSLPRRGRQLQDAIFLRLIALNKATHATAFWLLSLALGAIRFKLPVMQSSARDLDRLVTTTLDSTGRDPARQWIARGAHGVLGLDTSKIRFLLVLALIYAVVETTEAVGLWKERRWAEYLTVVATAGFLPLEVHELLDRVTVLRVLALTVNVALIVWLVLNKHLFGIRGGEATLHEHTDWQEILDRPSPAHHR